MSRLRIGSLIILTGILIGIWWMGAQDGDPSISPTTENEPLPTKTPSIARSEKAELNIPDTRFPSEIKDEFRTVHFPNSDDYALFLKRLESARLIPRRVLSKINSLQVKQSWLEIYGDDLNFTEEAVAFIQIPEPPDEQRWAGPYHPVGDRWAELVNWERPKDLASRESAIRIAILDTVVLPDTLERFSQIEYRNLFERDNSSGEWTHADQILHLLLDSDNGVAPNASVIAYDVLEAEGAGEVFDLAEAIIDAADQGVDIINLSLGTKSSSKVLHQAVQYAHERGVILIAAAGNGSGDPVSYPAAFEEVLAVTAFDGTQQVPGFTSSGREIDVALPGVGVNVSMGDSETVSFSGTSAAAPMLSGMLAHFLPQIENLTALKELISLTSNDKGSAGFDNRFGNGIFSAERWEHYLQGNGAMDLAISDLYLNPTTISSSQMEVEVVVQNRSQDHFPGGSARITVDGQPFSYSIKGLGPNQSDSLKVLLNPQRLFQPETLPIEVEVSVPGFLNDHNPDNNFLKANLSPIP